MILKNRKYNRLQNYDYSQNGYYFVTICTKDKIEYFGKIENEKMILNEIGKIANQCWLEISKHFPDVKLDEHMIMPNHLHGIVVIENNPVGNNNYCSNHIDYYSNNTRNENFRSLQFRQKWHGAKSHSLSSIIRGFKIGVTKWCRNNNYEFFQWQKSFYDHIIRNEKSLSNIREYIRNNPLKWELDRNNMENLYM